jgi:hypothetical protein
MGPGMALSFSGDGSDERGAITDKMDYGVVNFLNSFNSLNSLSSLGRPHKCPAQNRIRIS